MTNRNRPELLHPVVRIEPPRLGQRLLGQIQDTHAKWKLCLAGFEPAHGDLSGRRTSRDIWYAARYRPWRATCRQGCGVWVGRSRQFWPESESVRFSRLLIRWNLADSGSHVLVTVWVTYLSGVPFYMSTSANHCQINRSDDLFYIYDLSSDDRSPQPPSTIMFNYSVSSVIEKHPKENTTIYDCMMFDILI